MAMLKSTAVNAIRYQLQKAELSYPPDKLTHKMQNTSSVGLAVLLFVKRWIFFSLKDYFTSHTAVLFLGAR